LLLLLGLFTSIKRCNEIAIAQKAPKSPGNKKKQEYLP
jgi:hypothetical protein